MCEFTRLGNKSKLTTTKMTAKNKKVAFASAYALINAKSTKNPDLYFKCPFTGEYQHIFHVVQKDLLMRLSFLDNDISSSVTLKCFISHDKTTGAIDVSWKGDYARRFIKPCHSWFYSETML